MVDPRRDMGAFVKALVQAEPGKNLLGVASTMSWKEWAQLWGKINGVECRYEQMPDGALTAMMPGGLGREFEDMFRYMDYYGYAGNEDKTVVQPEDLGVEIKTTSMEEYIKAEDWSSVLNA
ncbi:hypothetical protein LTS18_005736 [Coniosporium uncinatum]|uniref:Uncharacterized protein n=1 Tax=Coniosporium uncinatum TaxID=93489 RepID=A0ACC3DBC5_9PEZI|nr:hypothetical protein LTS18_005736 [Coniosporium uncinatum]